jgi:hypothetical protein
LDDKTVIWINLLCSFVFILLSIWRRGLQDPLVVIFLFYFFFSFGPVINYLFDIPIYFGTKSEYISRATLIFLLASSSLFLILWIIPLKKERFEYSLAQTSELGFILRLANITMSLVSIFLIFKLISLLPINDKVQRIASIGSSLHYIYLLIQIYLTAFYFQIGKDPLDRKLYFINFLLYLLYSLLIGERDFIFIFLSLGLHWSLAHKPSKKVLASLVLGGGVLAFGGTLIFLLRDANQAEASIFEAVLNQGSILFINTYTLFLIDQGQEFFMGSSYMYAVLNLIPRAIWSSNFNMPDWFHDQYAPASTSGYGYALDAEGYLNFSWAGVVLTFLIIGLVQRMSFNSQRFRSFFSYYSVFYLSFAMYSLRNDSTAFLKGNFYALVSFAALHFLSQFLKKNRPKTG